MESGVSQRLARFRRELEFIGADPAQCVDFIRCSKVAHNFLPLDALRYMIALNSRKHVRDVVQPCPMLPFIFESIIGDQGEEKHLCCAYVTDLGKDKLIWSYNYVLPILLSIGVRMDNMDAVELDRRVSISTAVDVDGLVGFLNFLSSRSLIFKPPMKYPPLAFTCYFKDNIQDMLIFWRHVFIGDVETKNEFLKNHHFNFLYYIPVHFFIDACGSFFSAVKFYKNVDVRPTVSSCVFLVTCVDIYNRQRHFMAVFSVKDDTTHMFLECIHSYKLFSAHALDEMVRRFGKAAEPTVVHAEERARHAPPPAPPEDWMSANRRRPPSASASEGSVGGSGGSGSSSGEGRASGDESSRKRAEIMPRRARRRSRPASRETSERVERRASQERSMERRASQERSMVPREGSDTERRRSYQRAEDSGLSETQDKIRDLEDQLKQIRSFFVGDEEDYRSAHSDEPPADGGGRDVGSTKRVVNFSEATDEGGGEPSVGGEPDDELEGEELEGRELEGRELEDEKLVDDGLESEELEDEKFEDTTHSKQPAVYSSPSGSSISKYPDLELQRSIARASHRAFSDQKRWGGVEDDSMYRTADPEFGSGDAADDIPDSYEASDFVTPRHSSHGNKGDTIHKGSKTTGYTPRMLKVFDSAYGNRGAADDGKYDEEADDEGSHTGRRLRSALSQLDAALNRLRV